MEFNRFSSPHLPVSTSVNTLMRQVLLALLPGIACMTWLFGWGVPVNILLAASAALAGEALMLKIRGRPVYSTLLDGSALLTGVLLALALPPLAPWWIAVTGSLFGIVVAKQLYGGLGHNPFNPAMAGYVVLIISFPLELTLWTAPGHPPDLLTTLTVVFGGASPASATIDALTMATPMDHLRAELTRGTLLDSLADADLFGLLGGAGWEWINACYLLGGLYLLRVRAIQWQIPLAMLAGLASTATLFHLFDSAHYAAPQFHLFSGAAMLGAFFIATDPVSACTTPRGRIWYGLGIGTLTWVIRTWGGYPDGVAFAVLLMNLAAPTIDHYTRPHIFGHQRGRSP